MTLPVSSYEELLARVRSLTHETIQLQRELTTPLIDHNENGECWPVAGAGVESDGAERPPPSVFCPFQRLHSQKWWVLLVSRKKQQAGIVYWVMS